MVGFVFRMDGFVFRRGMGTGGNGIERKAEGGKRRNEKMEVIWWGVRKWGREKMGCGRGGNEEEW